MKRINLRDYYPFYQSDLSVEVSDEIELSLKRFDLIENAYQLRTYRHKAYYSEVTLIHHMGKSLFL